MLGCRIESVTIPDDPQCNPHCLISREGMTVWKEWAGSLAGPVAQRWIEDDAPGCGADFRNIDRCINEAFADLVEKETVVRLTELARSFEEAIEMLVLRHRPVLAALAAELVKRRTMGGDLAFSGF
jgi:hypothetical protein